MNSTAKRVPRITGFPAWIPGSMMMRAFRIEPFLDRPRPPPSMLLKSLICEPFQLSGYLVLLIAIWINLPFAAHDDIELPSIFG
jgi:hypothetical protein